jgi:hypothetical protein
VSIGCTTRWSTWPTTEVSSASRRIPRARPEATPCCGSSRPYLFKGKRPTLAGVKSEITYKQTYSITVSSDVKSVVMMSPASPTHSFDVNQREIPLQYANGKITINATPSLAPPGYYRLFAINDKALSPPLSGPRLK